MTGSLRFRLLAAAAVSVVLALALAGAVLFDLFRDHLRQRFDAELGNHLDQLAALVEVGSDRAVALRQPLSDPRFSRPFSGLYWQVGVGDGPEPGLRSRSLWDETLALPPDTVADGEVHVHRLEGPGRQRLVALERTVLFPGVAAPVRLAVAADIAELSPIVHSFRRVLWLSLAVLAVVLIAAALAQVLVGLRPLTRLRRDLAAVRDGRRTRVGADVPREVKPLVDDLNALLAHSEEVVGRARLQAGNLAHALKTNLAVLANAADSLEPSNARETGDAIARQVAAMRRHVDHHMARARAAAARGLPGPGVRVAECAAALARAVTVLNAGSGCVIDVRADPVAVFAGEREDLDEMLGNLLDNACTWAAGRVVVGTAPEGDGYLAVVVDDDGPGLPADRREAVLDPGVRLDESTPGSGLGLAVVRDVARLYGGDVRLEDSPLGGLRAVLVLPAA